MSIVIRGVIIIIAGFVHFLLCVALMVVVRIVMIIMIIIIAGHVHALAPRVALVVVRIVIIISIATVLFFSLGIIAIIATDKQV